jgi:3'-5' exoribonuclease
MGGKMKIVDNTEHIDRMYRIIDRLDKPYKTLCRIPLYIDTELAIKFRSAPGASSHHHVYIGGLAVHTSEVVGFCHQMAAHGINRNVLITAAVWHDVGKVDEYELVSGTDKYQTTARRAQVGHLVDSVLMFIDKSRGIVESGQLEIERRNDIVYCMLAHHGRREWGSPVEPGTIEAFILHSADMLSMQAAKRSEKL